ncbi:hypothetical protein SNE40_006419 [Patella caerulea]|uniref:Phospholipase A2-like central domain-containing protein n=1 Tax=Patella caerulea TaxID=87958 RepID=A0AAN8PVU6_PATCE
MLSLLISVVLAISIPGGLSEEYFFFNSTEDLGVVYVTDEINAGLDCYTLLRNSSEIENALEVTINELDGMIESCSDGDGRRKRAVINIIAPGTKWCGTGDVAKNDDDLGSNAVTDACCRTHDKCKPDIDGFGRKGTFINVLPWTRLHCDCDNAFHSCLKSARNTNNAEKIVADIAGFAYFHVTNTKCFKEHSYRICTKLGWFKCNGYTTFNTYKWHDNKSY